MKHNNYSLKDAALAELFNGATDTATYFEGLNRDEKKRVIAELYIRYSLPQSDIAALCGLSKSAISLRIKKLKTQAFESNPPTSAKTPVHSVSTPIACLTTSPIGAISSLVMSKLFNKADKQDNNTQASWIQMLLKLRLIGATSGEISHLLKESYQCDISEEELEIFFKVASAIEQTSFPEEKRDSSD